MLRRPRPLPIAAALLAAAALVAAPARAQTYSGPLQDSPWGDFPVGRLQPGARLLVVTRTGERFEARLAALDDGVLRLRTPATDTLVELPLESLRALQVRALPRWHDRAATIGFLAGAAIGAGVGTVAHRQVEKDGHRASRGETIAAWTSGGFFVGWIVGGRVVGRARWRSVTLR